MNACMTPRGGLGMLLVGFLAACGNVPDSSPTAPAQGFGLEAVRKHLPEAPGPETGEEVTLETLLVTVDRLQRVGLISNEDAARIREDPQTSLQLLRAMIDDPDAFGVDESRLRQRGRALAERMRHYMAVEGMSAEEAATAVREELRR